MSVATELAAVAVAALADAGVRHVVLCPGSRSAPLAYALHAADAAGRLRLHVRHDERVAAFTALGLALGKGTGPAAVVTTSGTAVANLGPATLEAAEAGVPLLLLTADRPHRLRGTWANQTTALQAGLLAPVVRWAADLAVPDPRADGAARAWRDTVLAAVEATRGRPDGMRPGPVHVDLAFDDPLVPDRPVSMPAPESVGGEGVSPSDPVQLLPAGPRTVVLAGASAGPQARRLAEQAGWPLLAEPSSGARGGPAAVGPYRLLLDDDRLGGRTQRAVVLGRPTLSRPVTRLLDRPDVEVVLVGGHPDDPGPAGPVRRVAGAVEAAADGHADWSDAWRRAGCAAADAVDRVLDAEAAAGRLPGPLLAREVAAATRPGELLVAAASNPVRDLDLAARPWDGDRRVLANRGLAGIDGTLSTAAGAALAAGPARVLVGDLAFLHDLNGLLLGPDEPEPDLQVLVLNDDGGGIFGLLEHGDPSRAALFDRVFGTPHGADLGALCAGLGVPHRRVDELPALRAALGEPLRGRTVVEVRADRAALRDLHARISAAVADAVEMVLAEAAS